MSGPPASKTTTTPTTEGNTMPNYRVLTLLSHATSAELTVRTVATDPDDEPGSNHILIFQTTRGASVWLGIEDVAALVDFGRAEVIAWEAQRNQPDDVVDAHITCGASDGGYDCALPDGHPLIGAGGTALGNHVTANGRVFY